MSETLPEPTLPIFGDKFVSYTVVHPRSEDSDSVWETIKVPADDIDSIEDSRFRDALWSQFRANETNEGPAVFAFVNPEGKYIHSVRVPRRPLGLTFTEKGLIFDEDLQELRVAKDEGRSKQREKSAGWLTRIFKNQR